MLLGWTTVARRVDADRLAAEAIAHGLAACVQVEGPIVSHYRWEGKNEQTEEFRLCFKFLPRTAEALEKRILSAHPYDAPEWIIVRAEHVSEKYLSWAEANSSTLPL